MRKTSKGLRYSMLNSASRSYALKGIGLCFDKNVVIPEMHKHTRVIRIAPEAFRGNKRIERVVIPEGVRSIGKCAFLGCESLAEVVLPSTLVTIEEGAFYGCKKLRKINLPSTVTLIPRAAFALCSSLAIIDLSNVKTIRRHAFKDCTSLNYICLKKITEISDLAFKGCKFLTDIEMPEQMCNMSIDAFSDCGIFRVERYYKKELFVIDGWIFGCVPDAEQYRIERNIRGIARGAFDQAKKVRRTPNPKYELQKEYYEMQLMMSNEWYHIPGCGQVDPPSESEKPKEFLEEKLPIRIAYEGSIAEWGNIAARASDDKFVFEITASDGAVSVEM